jgi:hypothetical protein
MTDMEHRGSCMCGAVRLSFRGGRGVGACHCTLCRKWSGGPMLAVESHGRVDIEGEEHVTVFASSDWAERGFCSRCGTHLFYRLRSGELYAMPVGMLQDGPDWIFEQQVFIDEKPAWYAFVNETRNLTGEQVFAAFAPPSD